MAIPNAALTSHPKVGSPSLVTVMQRGERFVAGLGFQAFQAWVFDTSEGLYLVANRLPVMGTKQVPNMTGRGKRLRLSTTPRCIEAWRASWTKKFVLSFGKLWAVGELLPQPSVRPAGGRELG